MSDNNNKGDKDELTGPYYTLSVADRTKALGLVPGTSPAEKRKPPLPPSPKPAVSPRGPHLFQDRNANKTNGTKSKVPPPVVPYRESKKRLHSSSSPTNSTSSPVHSPNATSQCPPSPEVFNAKSTPPAIPSRTSVSHSPPSPSPPVAASSYEEPVLRNVNERPPMPKPDKPSTGNGGNVTGVGIYSEVDTETIISIVGLKQNEEYSTAKYGRDDPSAAPPLPVIGGTYESLSRGDNVEKTGPRPVVIEEADGDVPITDTSTTTSANTKDDFHKDKKPQVPKLKPPLPAAKPVQYEPSPPKPKRTYAANMQPPEGSNLSTPLSPIATEGHRLSKPMPLPRAKSEDEDVSNKKVQVTGPERAKSQDETTSSKGKDKTTSAPGPYYCYVDIDIPDSPKPEQQSSATVSTSESSKVVSNPKQVDLDEPATATVKKIPPQSAKSVNKPRRRAPPPPPFGANAKPVQPNSNQVKPPIAPNKPKLHSGHPNTLPDPTPAKPIQPKKWFHLVTKKPGFQPPPPPVNDKKAPPPAVVKDAGNTPPASKRRDSKKRKFFQRHKQQSLENDSTASSAVDNKPTKVAATEEDIPDSPTAFGYDTVGPNKTSEKKITTANFKGGIDMTPHARHRVLAAYAEVELDQKIKKSTERPLTNAHSEEYLDKLFPSLSTEDNDNSKEEFVISPYGTLPRQRQKGSKSRSKLPVYAEVQLPGQRAGQPHIVNTETEESGSKKINGYDGKSQNSSGGDQKEDKPPQVPPQTADSLRLDSPSPQVPPKTADSLRLDSPRLDSPSPQVPPQTEDSLKLDSPSVSENENEVPVITAYATIETKDVVLTSTNQVKNEGSRRLSKDEIATKTKSFPRSLKPKNKPAPLPPHPTIVPQPIPRRKRVSRTHSAEASGDSDTEKKVAKSENKDQFKKEPLYESVDDLDINVQRKSIKSKSPPKKPPPAPPVVISDSTKQTEFLFKNRQFITIGKPSATDGAANYNNDDSDDSTDWDSDDEEEEEEEEQMDQRRGKVYHIAKELLTTERTFVKGLTLLDKDFRQAVLSANRAHDRPVLPEETLNAILSNVGSLCILNSGLLTQLEDRLKKWDSNPKIGDVLMNTAPFFKLYTEYISNFDKALKLLEESCKRNRAFGELVREFEGQPICANLPLSGYLLETVQRIPRYKLLLQDYLKHLPEDSEDRLSSERSLELISKVAAHVNESIRQVDNFKKLLDVQKKLVGDTGNSLISPSRKLLREGELLKYSRKEIQPRMFFLFTDLLIYASAVPPANTTYKVIKRIPLHGMKVSELDDPEVKHGLQIISTCKSFRLGTNTLDEKVKWMKALQDALFEHEAMLQSRERYRAMSIGPGQLLDNLDESLGTLAPPWLPDNCVSMCMMCSVRFNLTKRRHHCRACGNIFCGTCSSYLAALKYQDNKMDRVCQTCFEKLTGKGKQNVSGEFVSGKRLRQSPNNKRNVARGRSAVLEVKARERNCEISGYLQMKDKRWRKQWLEVAEFALYVFEKHEDVSAKRSISLPGYLVIYPLPDTTDKTQLCITHPGTGSIFFKTESEEVTMKWVEVFQNAVKLKSVCDND